MHKHTIPIHLEAQDKLLYGLTVKQVMVLALGLTLSYSAWSAASSWGLVLSLFVGLIPSMLAFLVAFLRPAGTPLDEWLLIWLFFLYTPKVYLWESWPEERSCSEPTEREQHETPTLEEEDEDL